MTVSNFAFRSAISVTVTFPRLQLGYDVPKSSQYIGGAFEAMRFNSGSETLGIAIQSRPLAISNQAT